MIAPLIVEFETSRKLDQRDNWFVLRNDVMNVLNHNVKRGEVNESFTWISDLLQTGIVLPNL